MVGAACNGRNSWLMLYLVSAKLVETNCPVAAVHGVGRQQGREHGLHLRADTHTRHLFFVHVLIHRYHLTGMTAARN